MSRVIHHKDLSYKDISQEDFDASVYTSVADATINPMIRVLKRLPAAIVSDFFLALSKLVPADQIRALAGNKESLLKAAFTKFPEEVKRAFNDATGKDIVESYIQPYRGGLISLGLLNILVFILTYLMAMFVIPSWPWVAWWPIFAVVGVIFLGVAIQTQIWASQGPMHTREQLFWSHYAKFCWSSFSVNLFAFIGMWIAYGNADSASRSSQFSTDITNEYQTQTGGMWQAEFVTFMLVLFSGLGAVYQFIYAIEQSVFKLVFDEHPYNFIQKKDPNAGKSLRYNGCCKKPGRVEDDILLKDVAQNNSRGAWGNWNPPV